VRKTAQKGLGRGGKENKTWTESTIFSVGVNNCLSKKCVTLGSVGTNDRKQQCVPNAVKKDRYRREKGMANYRRVI